MRGKEQLLCDAIRNLLQLGLSYFAQKKKRRVQYKHTYTFISAHFSHDCVVDVTCQCAMCHAANVRAYVCMYVCIFYAKTIKVIREKLKKKNICNKCQKPPKGNCKTSMSVFRSLLCLTCLLLNFLVCFFVNIICAHFQWLLLFLCCFFFHCLFVA